MEVDETERIEKHKLVRRYQKMWSWFWIIVTIILAFKFRIGKNMFTTIVYIGVFVVVYVVVMKYIKGSVEGEN